jgi:MFS family permease
MSIILSNVVLTYLDPIFALKMIELDIYADQAGYVYIFLMGSYSIFGFMGGKLESFSSKRNLIIMGYLAGVLGFSMIAHKFFLGNNYLPFIIIGLFLNGFSIIGGNMFATMLTKTKLMEECEKVGIPPKISGSYFGGLKGFCNQIGSFIGPLISPNFYVALGFEDTCLLMATTQLLFAVWFFFKTS